ncbi:MAG TPA: hypothetical protein PLP50_16640 [Thermoanaerobaculia bacterium]|nr:hypothetical protein [Thermoanaerobaculia bacterium]HQN09886.1 hypothetical protein [Thermoanaerobaculia bacterium]
MNTYEGLRVENARLADGYLEALDRLGAIRRLQVALKASQWEDEVGVAAILETILDAPGDDLKNLPGAFWTEPLDVRRVS